MMTIIALPVVVVQHTRATTLHRKGEVGFQHVACKRARHSYPSLFPRNAHYILRRRRHLILSPHSSSFPAPSPSHPLSPRLNRRTHHTHIISPREKKREREIGRNFVSPFHISGISPWDGGGQSKRIRRRHCCSSSFPPSPRGFPIRENKRSFTHQAGLSATSTARRRKTWSQRPPPPQRGHPKSGEEIAGIFDMLFPSPPLSCQGEQCVAAAVTATALMRLPPPPVATTAAHSSSPSSPRHGWFVSLTQRPEKEEKVVASLDISDRTN